MAFPNPKRGERVGGALLILALGAVFEQRTEHLKVFIPRDVAVGGLASPGVATDSNGAGLIDRKTSFGQRKAALPMIHAMSDFVGHQKIGADFFVFKRGDEFLPDVFGSGFVVHDVTDVSLFIVDGASFQQKSGQPVAVTHEILFVFLQQPVGGKQTNDGIGGVQQHHVKRGHFFLQLFGALTQQPPYVLFSP